MTLPGLETGPSDFLPAIRDHVDADVSHYGDIVTSAFAECDVAFLRRGYADFFWQCASTVPGWLAHVLIRNADAESHGSARLLKLWQRVDYDAAAEKQILLHARDESRHSRLFLDLVLLAYPGTDASLIDGLRQSLPDVRSQRLEKAGTRIEESELIDALVQMNIAEIRTRIHLQLFTPLIDVLVAPDDRERSQRMLRGLARDEIRHIAYTARLLDGWAADGSDDIVRRLYRDRLQQFHAITVAQTEGAVRAFGQGRFSDLLTL